MRKRLRKKLQVGEFQPWLLAVVIHFNCEDPESPEFSIWWDEFVNFVEQHDLCFGGGGKLPIWSLAVEAAPAQRRRVTPDDGRLISAYLQRSHLVAGYRVGPILPSDEYSRLLDDGEFDYVFVDIPPEHRAELERRIAEIDSGTAELIPWEEVKKQLYDRLPE